MLQLEIYSRRFMLGIQSADQIASLVTQTTTSTSYIPSLKFGGIRKLKTNKIVQTPVDLSIFHRGHQILDGLNFSGHNDFYSDVEYNADDQSVGNTAARKEVFAESKVHLLSEGRVIFCLSLMKSDVLQQDDAVGSSHLKFQSIISGVDHSIRRN